MKPLKRRCSCGIWFVVTDQNKEQCTGCKPPSSSGIDKKPKR